MNDDTKTIIQHVKKAKPWRHPRGLSLEGIPGVGKKTVSKLIKAGFDTVRKLANADVDDAGAEGGPVVAGPGDLLREVREGCLGKGDGGASILAHQLIQFPPSTLKVCATM